jgi:hypothetical protein
MRYYFPNGASPTIYVSYQHYQDLLKLMGTDKIDNVKVIKRPMNENKSKWNQEKQKFEVDTRKSPLEM